LQTLRSLEALEHIGSPEARRLLQSLATGVPCNVTREAQASLERLDKRAGQ